MRTPTLFSVTSQFFILSTRFFLHSITYVDPGQGTAPSGSGCHILGIASYNTRYPSLQMCTCYYAKGVVVECEVTSGKILDVLPCMCTHTILCKMCSMVNTEYCDTITQSNISSWQYQIFHKPRGHWRRLVTYGQYLKETAVGSQLGPFNRNTLRRGFPLCHKFGMRSKQTQIFRIATANENQMSTLFSVTLQFIIQSTQFFLHPISYVNPGQGRKPRKRVDT